MESQSQPSEAPLGRVAAWYVFFAVLFNLGYSGLMSPATDFLLKDRFHLGPEGMARYGVLIGLPGYGAFLYGYARDRWGPRLGGDRGVMLAGHAVLALAFGTLGLAGPSYGGLVALMLVVSVVTSFTVAGLNGALVAFGKRRAVADRLSGFLLVVGTGTTALAGLCAGLAAAHLPYRGILVLMAAINATAALWVFVAPRGTLGATEPIPPKSPGRSIPLVQDLVQLLRSRAFAIALGIGMARGLTLVSGTVNFFEFTNRLGAGPEMLGGSNALGGLITIGVGLLYLRFARRVPLRWTLALGLVLSLPGPLLILLVHRPVDLLPLAAWNGVTGALVAAPMGELLLRSMPSESAGLGYALNGTLCGLMNQIFALLGAWVYARHGIGACIALTLPISLLSPLLVTLVPHGMAGRPPEMTSD